MAICFKYKLKESDNMPSNVNIFIKGSIGDSRFPSEGKVGQQGLYEEEATVDVVVGIQEVEAMPAEYSLSQNYPNPFNPSTKIKISLPNSEVVQLKVYDMLGNELTTLLDEYKLAGIYEIYFDAERLTSGIYFYRMISGNFSATKKNDHT